MALAVVDAAFRDVHGPALLAGAVAALLVRPVPRPVPDRPPLALVR